MHMEDENFTDTRVRPKKDRAFSGTSKYRQNHKLNSKLPAADIPDSLTAEYARIVFVDTETTGLSFETDRITELSAILARGGSWSPKDTDTYMDAYIKLPKGVTISEEAKKACPIRRGVLTRYGIPEKDALLQFIELAFNDGFEAPDLPDIPDGFTFPESAKRREYAGKEPNGYEDRRVLFIGHNIHFDMNMILAACRRCNIEFPDCWDVLDTLSIFRDRHKYPHKLEAALDVFGIRDAKNSHLSFDDVWAVVRLLDALDKERKDLQEYVNLLGYPKKYGDPGFHLPRCTYLSQEMNRTLDDPTIYDENARQLMLRREAQKEAEAEMRAVLEMYEEDEGTNLKK